MIQLIKNLYWKNKIKKELYRHLLKRYGKCKYYSKNQLLKTIEVLNWKLSNNLLPFAVALYCERKEYFNYYKTTDFSMQYDEYRKELAPKIFRENSDFNVNDYIGHESHGLGFGNESSDVDSSSADSSGLD